jgi:hypothetical protein
MKRVCLAIVSIVLLASMLLAACETNDTTTTVSSGSSATTLAPGAMTFDTCIDRFETLIQRESLPGTLPYSIMGTEELAWLCEAAPQVGFTQAQGYRFASGDVVLLFFCDPPVGNASPSLQQALTTAAMDRYARSDEEIWAFVDASFGYVVASREYRSQLGTLANWARSAHQHLIDGQ